MKRQKEREMQALTAHLCSISVQLLSGFKDESKLQPSEVC